jgi:ketosteroid isomerase-like protein
VYSDPLTRVDLSGDNLRDHVQSVLDVIRDLRVAVTRTIADEDDAAVVWALEGTWDGKLGPLSASETPVRFEGTDVFELDDGRLRRLRRSFDQLALADALRLQTIVEPYGDGDLTFGRSMREWVSKAKPGALGMTWLLARDETEKLAIRARAREIVSAGLHRHRHRLRRPARLHADLLGERRGAARRHAFRRTQRGEERMQAPDIADPGFVNIVRR